MEFIREIYTAFYEITVGMMFGSGSDLFERILGAILMLLSAVVLALIVWLGYILLNEVWIAPQGIVTRPVVDKHYTPGHVQTMVISNGKTTTVVPQYIPPSYLVCFQLDDKVVCGNVSEGIYSTAKLGDQFNVEYGYGRLDGRYVIKALGPISGG